jgi:hypothetical protein
VVNCRRQAPPRGFKTADFFSSPYLLAAPFTSFAACKSSLVEVKAPSTEKLADQPACDVGETGNKCPYTGPKLSRSLGEQAYSKRNEKAF